LVRYYKRIAHKVLESSFQADVAIIIDAILESGVRGVVEEVRSFQKVVFVVINNRGG
jgi:hypothetical protein